MQMYVFSLGGKLTELLISQGILKEKISQVSLVLIVHGSGKKKLILLLTLHLYLLEDMNKKRG